MFRSTAVFLLILAFAASASARDYRRSRRDPRSARPPPVDYDAIRTKARAGVRAQLETWLMARTGILAVCDRCAGAGVLSDPDRACPDCPQSKGLVRRPEFDPESVDRFALDTRSKVQLPAPWSMLDVRPSALDGIAISACLIEEIRVNGRRQACALVKVRTVGDPDGPWHPDVSFWFEAGGAWRVKDPWTLSPPQSFAGWGRFPAGVLEHPDHEDGAKEILARAARRLYPKRPGKVGQVEFVARCRAPNAERKAVFSVNGRLRQKFHLRQKRLPLREGKCGDVGAQKRLIETLLNDLLGGSILPDPREYHLTRSGHTVLATGFAPSRYLEEVAVAVDEDGRPVSIMRTLAGRVRSIDLRYAGKGGRSLVSGWDRRVQSVRDSAVIRWRSDRPDWRPTHVKIVRPEGTYEITFSSR